nr:extracellular solute-binding protein [Clostridia bacterium]
MKRTLCLVVALLMLVASSALAAPNSEIVGSAVIEKHSFGATGLTELPIVGADQKVTFVLWKPLNSTVMESYDQCILYEEMEKRTGIHVEWVYPPVGSEAENFNLRVASLDLPHMFVEAWNRYTGGLDKAVAEGIYLPLTEYYNEGLTPNYQYLRETYPDIGIDTIQDSGELAAFWQFDYVGTSPWSGFWIRSDWLKECGLEEPVFVEDWTNMLRTFKEKYGAVMGVQIGALGGGGGDLDTNH